MGDSTVAINVGLTRRCRRCSRGAVKGALQQLEMAGGPAQGIHQESFSAIEAKQTVN